MRCRSASSLVSIRRWATNAVRKSECLLGYDPLIPRAIVLPATNHGPLSNRLTVPELLRLFGDDVGADAGAEHEAQMTRNDDFFKEQQAKDRAEKRSRARSGRKGAGKEEGRSKPAVPIPDSIREHLANRLQQDLMEGGDGMGMDLENDHFDLELNGECDAESSQAEEDFTLDD